MLSDQTTFFLSFLTIFLALAGYLWRLERKVDALAASKKNDDGNRDA